MMPRHRDIKISSDYSDDARIIARIFMSSSPPLCPEKLRFELVHGKTRTYYPLPRSGLVSFNKRLLVQAPTPDIVVDGV
jgi:hypothetical protein